MKEWVARISNLTQTERGMMDQLFTNVSKTADLLSKNDRERLLSYNKFFKPSDAQFYTLYTQLSTSITNLKPRERNFRTKLDKLEKDISTLRVQSASNLEKISGSIRKVNDDYDARERRVSDLQTPAIRPKVEKTFDSPISEFQNFITKFGGRTGGWDSQSHTEFLRQLQFHGPDGLETFLPNIPPEAVRAHIEWNDEYNRLKARMKAAINEMRENNKRLKEVEKTASPKVDPEIVRKRIEEREALKRKRQEELEEAEAERQRIEREKKKKKYEQLQKELKVKKPKPLVETPVEEIVQDLRPKRAFSSRDWERIRKRDNAVLARKAAAIQQAELEAERRAEKERKLAELNAKNFKDVKRDPERLMRPTAAQLAKQKKDDDEPTGPVNSIFDIPHRATPAWLR